MGMRPYKNESATVKRMAEEDTDRARACWKASNGFGPKPHPGKRGYRRGAARRVRR